MDLSSVVAKRALFLEQRPLIPRDTGQESSFAHFYRTAIPRALRPPLLPEGAVPVKPSLDALIERAEKFDSEFSFGTDIDEAHAMLFESSATLEEKHELLREWLSRYQPCLFGRLASKGLKGLSFDICWLDEKDIRSGEPAISAKIQRARRQWKDRAAEGLSHGFLIMINSKRLAYCKPSHAFMQICQRMGNLYLVESAPVEIDTIYTEAMPLRVSDEWKLFKAGVNIFYSGAHRTLNHDRRVPGGILISANSPGHLANSLVLRGFAADFQSAVEMMFDLAIRSVGNGGIGDDRAISTSWHGRATIGERCPVHRDIKAQDSVKRYSAAYHTDVLVPASVTCDPKLDQKDQIEVWPHLILDYITSKAFDMSHVNYGLFHGHPICEEAKYFNPWTPRRAYNEELFG